MSDEANPSGEFGLNINPMNPGPTPCRNSRLSPLIAIVEVLFVRFGVYSAAAYGLQFLWEHSWGQDPTNWLGLQFLIGMLWYIIPTGMYVLHRGLRPQLGLIPQNLHSSVSLGLKAFVALLLTNIGYMILLLLKLEYTDPGGSLILTACFGGSFFLLFLTKWGAKGLDAATSRAKWRENLLVIGFLLAFPLVFGLFLRRFTLALVLTVIWQFIFSGFGEELFFRGYIQSRLNTAFGRPYSLRDIQFGLGLPITAAIFAITHVFNTYSLVTGDGTPAWWWGVFTFAGGLVFGLLREKSGDFYAAGVAHGMEAVGEGIAFLF